MGYADAAASRVHGDVELHRRRFERRFFLRLWVKVREDWRDRMSTLRELGVLGS